MVYNHFLLVLQTYYVMYLQEHCVAFGLLAYVMRFMELEPWEE